MNDPQSEKTKPFRIPGSVLLGLLLLPPGLGLGLLFAPVFHSGFSHFQSFDIWMLILIIVYLIITAICMRKREHALRLLLSTYSIVISLAIAELFLSWNQPELPTSVLRQPMKVFSEAADTMPGIQGKIIFTVNSLGLRGPEPPALNKCDLRILCVGGSTTECRFITDRQTWPQQLQEKIHQRTGQNIYVGNAGRSGHFTLNHIFFLEHYDLVSQFDWIILMLGQNDMGTLLRDNYEERRKSVPEQTFYNQPKQTVPPSSRLLRLFRTQFTLTQHPSEFAVEDGAGAWYTSRRLLRQQALDTNPLNYPPPGLETALQRYEQNLRAIIALCRKRNQPVLLLTQPTLYQKDLPEELEKLLWSYLSESEAYTTEAMARILKDYNTTLIAVAREEGVDCLDLDSLLAKDTTIFYDDCHFNLSGCEQVAERLTDFFTPRLDSAEPKQFSEGVEKAVP